MNADKKPQMNEKLKEIYRKMQQAPELYVLISMCTKEPYVRCDSETFDDEILMYTEAETAKKAGEDLRKQEIPVGVAKIQNNGLLMFYSSLFTMGVNAIHVYSDGLELRIQVADFIKRKDPNNLENGKVWVENPELHLTMIYYMQEMRRQKEPKVTEEMKELQEEINANFFKGKFLVPLPEEREKGVPLVKMKDGTIFQPIFTDVVEFQKFNQSKTFHPVAVEAAKLAQVLPAEAKGVVVNPLGANMPLVLHKAGN